uniref:DUF3517 domain-containing protein n=2 Tax=Tetranychus urticae TaxID=32264 RepID=T1K7L4_TETUR
MEEDGAYLMPIQSQVYEYLYKRTFYVKKIIEDVNSSEDTLQLLRYCSWENPAFSFNVLNELLWQIEYTYAYELRPHLDLILHMLMISDSWQEARINNALSGLQDEREGLFDTIQRNKSHYQKRAYQCIKCLVSLFSNCPIAAKLLHYTPDLKKKWIAAINWLNEELERRPYASINQYAYNWSPPAQSNETSNGYYLERSNSAKLTLSKAYEICPPDEKDEIEEQEISEENESPPTAEFEFNAPGVPVSTATVSSSDCLATPSSSTSASSSSSSSSSSTTTTITIRPSSSSTGASTSK